MLLRKRFKDLVLICGAALLVNPPAGLSAQGAKAPEVSKEFSIEVEKAVSSLTWHPNGRHIAVHLNCCEVRIFDTQTKALLPTVLPIEDAANAAIAWSPNGKFLAVRYVSLRVYEFPSLRIMAEWTHPPKTLGCSGGQFQRGLIFASDSSSVWLGCASPSLAGRFKAALRLSLPDLKTEESIVLQVPESGERAIVNTTVLATDPRTQKIKVFSIVAVSSAERDRVTRDPAASYRDRERLPEPRHYLLALDEDKGETLALGMPYQREGDIRTRPSIAPGQAILISPNVQMLAVAGATERRDLDRRRTTRHNDFVDIYDVSRPSQAIQRFVGDAGEAGPCFSRNFIQFISASIYIGFATGEPDKKAFVLCDIASKQELGRTPSLWPGAVAVSTNGRQMAVSTTEMREAGTADLNWQYFRHEISIYRLE